jgi:predicted RNA-binding Zn-ribbon protein involved in translation (DUF1610 family)
MTDRDRWTERLRCPNCGLTGSVVLSQANPANQAYHEGDENVRVEMAPAEFSVVVSDLGCQFYCASCGALAHHLTRTPRGYPREMSRRSVARLQQERWR